jgi:hypothetical protein
MRLSLTCYRCGNYMDAEPGAVCSHCRATAFSRFVPIVQSPHMTHERDNQD